MKYAVEYIFNFGNTVLVYYFPTHSINLFSNQAGHYVNKIK